MENEFYLNPTPQQNRIWGVYSPKELRGFQNYNNVTRITKLKIVDKGVEVKGKSAVGSEDILPMIFSADRNFSKLTKPDQSCILHALQRGARAPGRVTISKSAYYALRRAHELR